MSLPHPYPSTRLVLIQPRHHPPPFSTHNAKAHPTSTKSTPLPLHIRSYTKKTLAIIFSLPLTQTKRHTAHHMENLKPCPANSSPLTPLGFLERAAVVYGDCASLVYDHTSYTWAHTHRRCLQLGSSLQSLRISPGDVVSVIAPNTPPMYELQFAVPMSGAILNNINTRLDARTVYTLLKHSETKLVFVDCLLRSLVLEAISMFPRNEGGVPKLVLITDAAYPQESCLTENFHTTYEAMIEKGDPNFKWVEPKSEWDPMVLNYTSGTTSSPKGVVHSHRGLFIITVGSLIDWNVPKQPVYLWTLPIFHANGWSYPWGMAALGGTNICLRKFDGSTIFEMVEKHRVTHLCAAPVVLNMLTNAPNQKSFTHKVEILTAGAPPPAAVLFRTEELGFGVSHGYGLTETAGLVVSCAWKRAWNKFPADERAKLKSRQGVKIAGFTEIDVVDDEGKSVKRDGLSLGEVVLRGGCVMLGYLKDPMGTSKCMKNNGWFYTGDVGVMHEDGYIEIKDRSKDVIISGGENISSVEVESVLYRHKGVNEAAVVGRPDEYWGETPCAFVSVKEGLKGRVSEKEIVEFCKEMLPRYMVPKTVVFKEELPKTSTGKIQKFVLRDIARAMGSGRGSRM